MERKTLTYSLQFPEQTESHYKMSTFFSVAINLPARRRKVKINDSQIRTSVHGSMATTATLDRAGKSGDTRNTVALFSKMLGIMSSCVLNFAHHTHTHTHTHTIVLL